MNKSIKTLVVGMLGVLLTTGAVAKPAHAMSGIDFLKQNQQNQQYQAQTQVQEMYVDGKLVALDGIVHSAEQALKYEGFSTVNSDASKVVRVQDGQFLSSWVKNGNAWAYYDPTTHYSVKGEVRVIDGKEYCFNGNGRMLQNENSDSAYYGADGAKVGGINYNVNGGRDTSKVAYNVYDSNNNLVGVREFSVSEVSQKIREGKFKVSIHWTNFGGITTDSLSIYVIE
ncbi:hypothetical protein [Clostridium butyricum]|uniref:hypothetical protein n=1 Tax=Clostridium butyricum TaxID=1492 RepID=UPI002ABDE1F9|nr:hypothetical protein [Clostridium butyricum]